MLLFRSVFFLLSLVLLEPLAFADAAAFDLPGPRVEVRVTRGGRQLPIAAVPNLQAGDRLWVHPDFPPSQSAHYLLIVAFLRGTTNPPPDNWFTRIESWDKHIRQEGKVVTVPAGAEQALLFLAPETGGDFSTLRSNVRGRPGAFVRAAQDLNRAGLDRSRLDAYLAAVKRESDIDPADLKQASTLLARSLNIKVDDKCFDKPTQEQAPCLMQNTDQLVLQDAHGQSMVAELTSGAGADLIGQISNTRLAGGGYYSAYVGAIVDVARLLATFHTAEYQYIPALAVPKQDQLNLLLNAAPSFQKPKSVLVIGLPAITPVQLPPLRAVDSKAVYCAQSPSLVLPVDDAPLVFSTSMGHDWTLGLWSKYGASVELPVSPDAMRGGFVVGSSARGKAAADVTAELSQLPAEVSGTLHGLWGFDSFEGPTFHLRTAHPATWTIVPADESALIVGRDDTLHLKSDAAECVNEITVTDQQGKQLKSSYKVAGPQEVQVEVAMKDAAPGSLTLQVRQFGLSKPDVVSLHSYAEAGHLETFAINAGDRNGVLKGTRLDEVASLSLDGVHFQPASLKRAGGQDELEMLADASVDITGLHAADSRTAHVTLKDGRTLDLQTSIQPARPAVTLISKNVRSASADASPIQLSGDDELRQDAVLVFSLNSRMPESFPRDEKIEIATQDDSAHATLSLSGGGLVLQDANTVLATLDPRKDLPSSAFGPLRFRPVAANGESGDWQPLVTLVRLPVVHGLRCPPAADAPCTLEGSALYLLDAVSNDPQFQQSTPVPDGFAGSSLQVPRPNGQELYVKLRDNPATVNRLELPVQPQP